ncbi:MAG: single-stranded DNA-binding protein [Chloroflexi bacterium]|nr:single-stranded DNA-binding protein [Chloroflexota bacterium]
MYQQITIIGRVGRDPELRYTSNGTGVCSFSVAVSKKWTDRNSNEKKEKTTWYKVSAWRQLAETCSQFVHKGMLILIVADEVEVRAYTGQDGNPQASLEITARDVKFLSSKGDRGGGTGEDYAGGYSGGEEPEDIPF